MYTSSLNIVSERTKNNDTTSPRQDSERFDGVIYNTPLVKVFFGPQNVSITEDADSIELTQEEEERFYEQALRRRIL